MATRTKKIDERQRHEQRLSWFVQEAHRQSANRNMRAKAERYADHEAISAARRAEIEARGQSVVQFNEIKPTIDWLLGTERRGRVDFNVMPRSHADDQAQKDAENKTSIIKWVQDVNRSAWEWSQAWDDAVKAGLGWIEIGIRGDTSECPIYLRHVPWRYCMHDSLGSEGVDINSGRYFFRIGMFDYDVARSYFPGRANDEKLLKVRQDGDSFRRSGWSFQHGSLMDIGLLTGDGTLDDPSESTMPLDLFNVRERVMLMECWSLEPLDEPAMQRATPSAYDRQRLGVRVSIMTEFDTLTEDWSPYKHGRYPFIPVWAYRKKRTGMPYSPIVPLMDKQDALNSAISKALFEGSMNQVSAEKGAIDPSMPINVLHAEAQDPAGFLIFADGALQGGKVQRQRGMELAQGQMMFADMLRMSIRDESAVSPSNRGLDSAAQSGKAIVAQQEQGGVLSTELFDNLRLARQNGGEMLLSLIEQYMVEPRVIAVRNDRGALEELALNQPGPDGQVMNDITARSAQFIIGEQPWRQSLMQSAFEKLMELLTQVAPVAPQIVVPLLPEVFELADLPNKAVIVEKLREITGQPGPNGRMTPEQQQKQEQKQQLEQTQMQLQMETAVAALAEMKAKGAKLDAERARILGEAVYNAVQSAGAIATNPAIAPVADTLLKEAGFPDSGPGPMVPQPPQSAVPPQQMQPPPEMPPEGMPPEAGPPQPMTAGVGEQSGIETPALGDGGPPVQG